MIFNLHRIYNFIIVTFTSFSFLSSSPILSLDPIPLSEKFYNNKTGADVAVRLERLIVSLKELHRQGLLDGEVLIAKGDQVLLRMQSNDIASNLTREEPQFMIGSLTKQFFATALLKALYDSSKCLTEKTKIADVKKKLRQPLSHFLPRDSTIWNGKMPTWAHKVTLHHLLSHTSGIPNYTDYEDYFSNQDDSEKLFLELFHSNGEILQIVSKDPLQFTPGSEFSYSNTNYIIIAEVLETITKTSTSTYLQQALFDPLELSSTSNPSKGKWEDLKLQGMYSRLVPQWESNPQLSSPLHSEDISAAQGSGSIISTAPDLLKWNLSLHKEQSILPESLYQLLTQENLNGYAYGIGIHKTPLGIAFEHLGKIGTYRTILQYLPDHDLSVIVLSHVNTEGDEMTAINKISARGYDRVALLLENFSS